MDNPSIPVLAEDLTPEQQQLLDRVLVEIPLSALGPLLSEDAWVREVQRDIQSRIPSVRTKAIEMWGKYLGLLGARASNKGPTRKEVTFSE